MSPMTRCQLDQGSDSLVGEPQTGNTRNAKKKKLSHSSQDTEETLDNSTGCPDARAVPEALPKPSGKAATRKHDRELDDAAREQVEKAKKPRIDAVSRDLASAQGHHSAVQDIIERLCRKAREADEREVVIEDDAKRAHRDLAKQKEKLTTLKAQLKRAKTKTARQAKELNEARMVKQELEDLQRQHARLQSENQELETKVERERKRAEFLNEQLFETLEETKPDRGDPNKVTDDEITAKWGILSFTIEQLATVCTKSPIKEPEVSAVNTSLDQLIRECKRSPPLSNYLIQRFIWRRLCTEVFQAKSGLWGGRIGELFIDTIAKMRDLDKGNEKNLSLVSRMKYKTANDINSEVGLSSKILHKLGTTLFDDLSHFISPSQQKKIQDNDLPTLFSEAAELMVIITRSRAIFTIDVDGLDPHHGPRPFDSHVMNIHFSNGWSDMNEGLEVDLLMSPSLEKIGLADGGRFGSRLVLCKANAVTHVKINQPGQAVDVSYPADGPAGSPHL